MRKLAPPSPLRLSGLLCLFCCATVVVVDVVDARRVAIIGGGISGTFAARYLAEYDANHTPSSDGCSLDEIVVYDVSPPLLRGGDGDGVKGGDGIDDSDDATGGRRRSTSDPRPIDFQGSRVSSVTLDDGTTVVELGASVVYDGNRLVVDMMAGDPDRLVRVDPADAGASKDEGEEEDGSSAPSRLSGVGIYHGNGEWLLNTAPLSVYPHFVQRVIKPLYFLWRYNSDYFRLNSAVKRAVSAFDLVYDLLDDTEREVTYFESPMDMWEAVGLRSSSGVSFHDFLDGLGLHRCRNLEFDPNNAGDAGGNDDEGASWWDWRRWLPGVGCLRAELLSGITINTYNQNLNQLNGLVGLVAYVPAGGEVFSVRGGNHQLMESAMYQAKSIYSNSSCGNGGRVRQLQRKITSVVASEKSMELYENGESLGRYDVVILAAPLQQCRIQFLVENPMGLDEAVLHDMPLGGVTKNVDSDDVASTASNENGEHLFASPLPPSATEPYTTVVTTVISNATLNATYFGLKHDEPFPRSILVSERGKYLEGITTLAVKSDDGRLVKTFSSAVLPLEQRNAIFGPNHVVEYVQVWGTEGGKDGKSRGGATPNFGGGRHSESLPYLLYDGSKHWGKDAASVSGGAGIGGPALYYVNACESTVAAIEISAIGAKSTAKLVARRLGLIAPKTSAGHDEL